MNIKRSGFHPAAHLQHCLTQAIHSPDPAYRDAKVAEASTAIARLVRS